mgnify:CR=1 FL=1
MRLHAAASRSSRPAPNFTVTPGGGTSSDPPRNSRAAGKSASGAAPIAAPPGRPPDPGGRMAGVGREPDPCAAAGCATAPLTWTARRPIGAQRRSATSERRQARTPAGPATGPGTVRATSWGRPSPRPADRAPFAQPWPSARAGAWQAGHGSPSAHCPSLARGPASARPALPAGRPCRRPPPRACQPRRRQPSVPPARSPRAAGRFPPRARSAMSRACTSDTSAPPGRVSLPPAGRRLRHEGRSRARVPCPALPPRAALPPDVHPGMPASPGLARSDAVATS